MIRPDPDATHRDDTLTGTVADYRDRSNPDLMDRWTTLHDRLARRQDRGLPPFLKVNRSRIGPRGLAIQPGGEQDFEEQFAVQDCLSPSGHPAVCEAAHAAVATRGVHSSGPAALMGVSDLLVALEARIARFLGKSAATVFPTGRAAACGAIRTLAAPGDHVVIDVPADASLHEGDTAPRARVHRFPHLSTGGAKRRLARIRAGAPGAGILAVTEGVFPNGADSPDLAALQAACRQHRATLLVDVANDLGATGPGGTGQPGFQGVQGTLDVVTGSFSGAFASNGGFVPPAIRRWPMHCVSPARRRPSAAHSPRCRLRWFGPPSTSSRAPGAGGCAPG